QVENDGRVSDGIAREALDPRADTALSALKLCLSDLATVDARSALWDAPLNHVLDDLHTLRTRKIADRKARDRRVDVADALSRLQAPKVLEELAFLRLREACAAWSVDGLTDTEGGKSLPIMIANLAEEISAHRDARLSAQHAEDDEQLEAFTGKR